VLAIDRWENPHFLEIHEALRSRIDYRQLSVYDLNPAQLGYFDIVLFMGVLYHLKHPLLALERVASVSKDMVAVESFVLKERQRPGISVEEYCLMEFYENDEFGGEFDNWVAPTVPCLLALCRTAGFARVELNSVHEYGAAVTCYRTWERHVEPVTTNPGIQLIAAVHPDNFGINFRSSSSDDYVACRIVAEGVELTEQTVRPEVSGFGSRPVFVGMVQDCWQVNFRLPPGLLPGWRQVRLVTPEGASNTFDIAVDIPLTTDRLEITGVADGVSWAPKHLSHNGFVSIWVRGLPRNADHSNVRVYIGGRRQITTFVGPTHTDGISQINANVNPGTPLGMNRLRIRFGTAESDEFEVEVSAAGKR